jgi:hypothetical protein
MTDEKKYLFLKEGAVYAGCSERFLRRRIAEGELLSSLVAGRRFVTREAIDAMMRRHLNRRSQRGRGIRFGRQQASASVAGEMLDGAPSARDESTTRRLKETGLLP